MLLLPATSHSYRLSFVGPKFALCVGVAAHCERVIGPREPGISLKSSKQLRSVVGSHDQKLRTRRLEIRLGRNADGVRCDESCHIEDRGWPHAPADGTDLRCGDAYRRIARNPL